MEKQRTRVSRDMEKSPTKVTGMRTKCTVTVDIPLPQELSTLVNGLKEK
jgi:hypothetical protein